MLNIYTCVFSIDLVESVRLQKFVVIGLVSWGLVEILGLLTKIIKNVRRKNEKLKESRTYFHLEFQPINSNLTIFSKILPFPN